MLLMKCVFYVCVWRGELSGLEQRCQMVKNSENNARKHCFLNIFTSIFGNIFILKTRSMRHTSCVFLCACVGVLDVTFFSHVSDMVCVAMESIYMLTH